MYSQNKEEQFIVEYFKGFVGNLLDIGANDGKTISNSLRLIELGWRAALVEPEEDAFSRLEKLHRSNNNVAVYNCAIGVNDETATLYASGEHLKKGDTGLLSTLVKSETDRWKGEKFEQQEVCVRTYDWLFEKERFHFITIDAEGMDVAILKQIDLAPVHLICIEWNSVESAKHEILSYCGQFGMNRIIHENAENLLIAR